MRSTDRDLLVAQKVLAPLRFNKKTDLVAKAQARAKSVIQTRLVEMSVNGKLTTMPRETKTSALYDMTVTIETRNIPIKDEKYSAKAVFHVPGIIGQGKNNKEKEHHAKEEFRKAIANGLREEGSQVRDAFFAGCVVLDSTDQEVKDKDTRCAVLEKFRVWIGNSLRKVDGVYRERFFKVVRLNQRNLSQYVSVTGGSSSGS